MKKMENILINEMIGSLVSFPTFNKSNSVFNYFSDGLSKGLTNIMMMMMDMK